MTLVQTMKQKTMWLWGMIAFLSLGAANSQYNAVYTLPSFSLVLKVDKSDKALILFQDRLQEAIREHLGDFFKSKVEIPSFGNGNVDRIDISSRLVWKELGSSANRVTDESIPPIMQYQARGDYDCELELSYNSAKDGESRLSQSIIDLFLIEAFQGDNYWHLVHNFLSDEILEDITDVKITVMADGYIQYRGQDPSAFDDYSSPQGDWTGAMTVGVIFAAFFCLVLAIMWMYLCFFVKGSFKFKRRNPHPKYPMKDESVTDDLYSTASVDLSADEEARWMDDWANAVTSIPLREPIKVSKKQKRGVRHPAQQHNTFLDSIEESDGDEESTCVSIEDMDYSQRRQNLQKGGEPIYPTSTALVPYASPSPNATGLTKYKPQQTKSRTKVSLGKTLPQFQFATSQPQLENKEIC